MKKEKAKINYNNRRVQMTRLCQWLVDGLSLGSGAELAKLLGISQSTISGHLSADPEAATPKDELRKTYADFLNGITVKNMQCDKWSIATFTEYMDSNLAPDAFIKHLENKPIAIRRMSVQEIHDSLTDEERLQMLEIYISNLKKNCAFNPALTQSYA